MELKIKDLRIGNYVSGMFEIEKIEGIYLSFVNTDGRNHAPLQQIKPIPITEEWLLKLGFEYNSFSLLYSNRKQSEYDIQIIDDTFVIHKYGEEIVTLKYIHELQNLFFALTKNELKINK